MCSTVQLRDQTRTATLEQANVKTPYIEPRTQQHKLGTVEHCTIALTKAYHTADGHYRYHIIAIVWLEKEKSS